MVLARADGSAAGVAHAGWRGLADGVLEATVAALGPGESLHAYLGPAIGPAAFEVGGEVRAAFVDQWPEDEAAFRSHDGRWLADLYALARARLIRAGLRPDWISGGGVCTFTEADRFYSHRRDGRTGRMATLVWLDPA